MLVFLESLLLFLTVLFLPTQLGRHFWPSFTFVYSLPIDYLSPTIYFWDLLVLLLIITGLLVGQRINKLALNIFLIFYFSQLLSLLPGLFGLTLNLGAGLIRLEQYLIAGLFGVYIASKDFSKTKQLIFTGLLLGLFLEGLLAIGQFLTSSSIGFWIIGEREFNIATPAIAKFDFQGIQLLRPYATFPHPNVLAGFMAVSLPVAIFLYKGVDLDKFFKLWTKISLAIMAIVAVITVSRSGIMAFSIASLLSLEGKVRKIFLGMLLLVSPFLYIRFSSLFNFDNLSILRREELMDIALKMFFSSPIFGIGLNNFIPEAADSLLVGPSRFLQPVHNIFLLSLSETGLIGFAGLIFLLGVPIYYLFKNGISKNRLLLTSFAMILFLGMLDHYFLTLPQGYRLLFFVWGLAFSARTIKS